MQVTYELDYRQDDLPVRGNAMVSGDDALDRETEDKILSDLERGNKYAWAFVELRALVKDSYGYSYQGIATLGACCYNSDTELRKELLTDDSHGLKAEALADLKMNLLNTAATGERAALALKELEATT